MTETVDRIKTLARELLTGGKVDVFIGYQDASVPLASRPLLIPAKKTAEGDADIIDRLTWNSFCSNNLAVFLPKYFENAPFRKSKDPVKKTNVGIVAKACDLRSIVALSKERHAPVENVITIGVPCMGKYDRRKIETAMKAAGFDFSDIDRYEEQNEEAADGQVAIHLKSGKSLVFSREKMLQDACAECRFPMPEGTTHLLEGKARNPGDGGYGRIEDFEKLPLEERWAYFSGEMEKCIRCNACRQACPTCYCKECFAEMTDLKWIGVSTDLSDAMIFHIIRIFHQSAAVSNAMPVTGPVPWGWICGCLRGRWSRTRRPFSNICPCFHGRKRRQCRLSGKGTRKNL